jgi:hypothetical protein
MLFLHSSVDWGFCSVSHTGTLRNTELSVLDQKDVENLTSIVFVLLLARYERFALHMGGMTGGPRSMPREHNYATSETGD